MKRFLYVYLGGRDLHENTVLHTACKYKHVPVVEWALAQPSVDLNALNVAGDTPLILGAAAGSLEIVKMLVAKGADVNRANDHGNTAMHYACFWRHRDIAVYLSKEAGAWVAIKNKYQKTPLGRTSDEIKDLLKAEAAGTRTVQAPARTFAQAKEEAKVRFLAKGGVDWEITATSVQTSPSPLSTTHFFVTRRGRWNGYDVIIRTPADQSKVGAEDVRMLKGEIGAIRKLFHANLLPLLAACATPPNVGVLTELVPSGDLWTFLHDPNVEMTMEMAMGIAEGVCRGMQFLHDQDPPIFHSNLKSQNILLTPDVTPRITDYGFSLPLFSPHRSAGTKYLNRTEWLAPEVLRGAGGVELWGAVDVYAYGMLLHEIVTRSWPYEVMNAMVVGMRVVLEGVRPLIPEFAPDNLAKLMTECWATDPKQRPTFSAMLPQLALMEPPVSPST
ncbi:kinase-like domain-containing protein [Powellomyces hirtus]|nr:kinase-like domain-containing protein [Powellomyces hirtus]